MDRYNRGDLAHKVPVDFLEVGHRGLGGGRCPAFSLEAAVELVRLNLHAVLEGLVVHHHVARNDRDLMFLYQVRRQVRRAIGNYAYGHIPLMRFGLGLANVGRYSQFLFPGFTRWVYSPDLFDGRQVLVMRLSAVDQVYLYAGKSDFQALSHRLSIGRLSAGPVVEGNDGIGIESGQVEGGP